MTCKIALLKKLNKFRSKSLNNVINSDIYVDVNFNFTIRK